MALFFDQSWFDERLKALGLSHEALASEMGLPLTELAAIWKDQRELNEGDVQIMADMLLAEPSDIAKRAGISTPNPDESGENLQVRVAELERRVQWLEAQLAKSLSDKDERQ